MSPDEEDEEAEEEGDVSAGCGMSDAEVRWGLWHWNVMGSGISVSLTSRHDEPQMCNLFEEMMLGLGGRGGMGGGGLGGLGSLFGMSMGGGGIFMHPGGECAMMTPVHGLAQGTD